MIIGVHAGSQINGLRTGVEEYIYQLSRSFSQLADAKKHTFIFYSKDGNILDQSLIAKDNGPEAGRFVSKKLRWPFFWTQMRLSAECILNPPDVLFSPVQVPPLLTKVKTVITVHGLEFLYFPDKYSAFNHSYLYWGTRAALKKAAHIIAVSESTKADLINYFNQDPTKISVVYHGFSSPEKNTPSAHALDAPYFIYIGRIETKKNVDGLIQAFDMFKQRKGSDHQLMLVGKNGFGFDSILKAAKESKSFKDVIFAGYLDEESKWRLLRYAEALVFPSWYEGFGLPILEAQALGVPVICGNNSSMPEVAGQGAIFVDVSSADQIAEALDKISSDKYLRRDIIDKGTDNSRRFSWEHCAQNTLQILTQI
ncbi:MAG: hypothetical protein A3A80_01415 [Candidatus Terrybacteria bacterium RIFCSPLOWO2_01_FULL_44_24]|uniref:Glycosyl transferase family 1 domain-containing protein n=1 Tax=Candidatus Terrybacteria bacterium RIFCSPHIGHO2_01_FULL_43_35 TaxID=1802361 RepID=A0A1G2PFG2_9BACT|nr:MAG: hypothetical protein A2828_03790 [Candidatus Terrybacteria bacterium RIFCSPHIGHO2_01_FULL_43_35]OHA49940.1 MAG: hypothetical protein A3B75_03510 [Candidatus Terrybacteria bacterium RIFCSPHIGHO2_02_FULL_43_14]OHA51739.1 MAG: hypothetical protein A3A80_01415 [Candidatus Terrybacteria bacterium RIFCSPLOWO2_01_FULL_44_24]